MISIFSKLLIQFLPINNGVELGFVGEASAHMRFTWQYQF